MPPYFFSPSAPRPIDPHTDHWQSFTYLQYIRGVSEDAYEWSLSWVQVCRFAWRLPAGCEVLEGKVASLGIDRLGLKAAEISALLHAVAGRGVRAPGTLMILRVARPWCALFEPAIGDEPELPLHWTEALELHGDPLSLWIGHRALRHPLCPALPDDRVDADSQARNPPQDRDLSAYEPCRWGWKLRDSPPLPEYLTGETLHGR